MGWSRFVPHPKLYQGEQRCSVMYFSSVFAIFYDCVVPFPRLFRICAASLLFTVAEVFHFIVIYSVCSVGLSWSRDTFRFPIFIKFSVTEGFITPFFSQSNFFFLSEPHYFVISKPYNVRMFPTFLRRGYTRWAFGESETPSRHPDHCNTPTIY